jgi:hypothetical protein
MKHKDTKAPREKALSISLTEFARRSIRNALPRSGNAPWMRYAGLVAGRLIKKFHDQPLTLADAYGLVLWVAAGSRPVGQRTAT